MIDKSQIVKKFKKIGLRPTRQRILLYQLLNKKKKKHFTALTLFHELKDIKKNMALASIYNNLNQFYILGLINKVIVDKERTWFDTNTSNHHHFFDEDSQKLKDINSKDISFSSLPKIPEGMKVSSIDVTIRIKSIDRE